MSSIVAKGGNGEPIRPWSVIFKATAPEKQPVVDALKTLLADAFSLYTRAHGLHWNVKGQDFSQYHALFESVYSDTYESVDPIAENILKMGSDAPYQMTQFIALRTIADSVIVDDPAVMAADLLAANEAYLVTLNRAFAAANDANEQGIANFVAERIDAHQKWSWQLRASLGVQTA